MNNIETKKSSENKMTLENQNNMMLLSKDTAWNFLKDLQNTINTNKTIKKTLDGQGKEQSILNIKDILIYLYHQKCFYQDKWWESSKYLKESKENKDFIKNQNDFFIWRALSSDIWLNEILLDAIKEIKKDWSSDQIISYINDNCAYLWEITTEINKIINLHPDKKEFNTLYKNLKKWKDNQWEENLYTELYTKIKTALWQEQSYLFRLSLNSKQDFAKYINWLAKEIQIQDNVLKKIELDLKS